MSTLILQQKSGFPVQTPPEQNPFNYPQQREYLPRVIERNGERYINVKELKTMVQQSIHRGSPPEWTNRAIVRYLEIVLCHGTKQPTWQVTENETLSMSIDKGEFDGLGVARWKSSLRSTRRGLKSYMLSAGRKKG